MINNERQGILMDKVSLVLHKDYLKLFGFLKDNPTRLERKGDFYRLTYHLPYGRIISPFKFGKVLLNTGTITPDGWELIRDIDIAIMGNKLLTGLLEIESESLAEHRQGTGLPLMGWIFDTICYGIVTPEETAYLVRLMFLAGYDFEQVTALFSAIVKKIDLAGFFLQEMNRLYKGVDN